MFRQAVRDTGRRDNGRNSLRLYAFIPFLLILMLLLAACGSSGSSNSSSSGSSSGSTPTTAPTTAPTATSTTAPAAVIKTATATVKGTSETILTNAQGMTLYYFTPDTTTTAACTGGCAGAWPPLIFNGSGTPTSATSLSGTLSAVSDGNGNQVEYNGHPLYTFSGDSAAGQTNGEGISGKWFVATPSLKVQGSSQSTSSGYGSTY